MFPLVTNIIRPNVRLKNVVDFRSILIQIHLRTFGFQFIIKVYGESVVKVEFCALKIGVTSVVRSPGIFFSTYCHMMSTRENVLILGTVYK